MSSLPESRPCRPRQTQSYLRALFARQGIAPQHRYGQNFLIDLNIHDLIVKTADVGPDDVVLEVGPGAGAMTALMASKGAAVIAVDIDPGMVRLAAEATAGMPNVRVLQADALANKNTMNPDGARQRPRRARGVAREAVQARGEPALQRRHADREQPARPPRALPREDGRDDPARTGRADARRARHRAPTAPSPCWCRPWPTSSWCGSCPRRSSGPARRSIRR